MISNRANAAGAQAAQARGFATQVIESRGVSRAQHDAAMIRALHEAEVELIVLAGYLRLLTPEFIRNFAERIVKSIPRCCRHFPDCTHKNRRSHTA